MKKHLRWIAGMALGAVMMQALPVFADLPTSEDGLWEIRDYEDGTVSVSLTDKTVETAEVPKQVGGRTVTMVEVDCFNGCENLKSVKLPDTITVIEDYSFYNCAKLEEVNIPASVQNIGFQAFYGCAAMESFKIPAGTNDIEQFAFEGCSSLKSIDVSDGNKNYKDEDGVLFDIDGTVLILYPSAKEDEVYELPAGCTKIEDYAFIGNTYLRSVKMDQITELGEDAFYYCTALETAEIPDSITELDGSVFGNCQSLKTVRLPAYLTSIGSGCFYNCMKLEEISIPETVTTINEYAFFNCPMLKEIRLTKTTNFIGSYALGFYSGDSEKPLRMPGFTVDASDDTAAFTYCVNNSIRCTGGITQGSVFVIIIMIVVALVIATVIVIVVLQKRYQKRYE